MKIRMNDNKTVAIHMRDQIGNVIKDFEEYDHSVDGTTVTPVMSHLFDVNDEAEQLNE